VIASLNGGEDVWHEHLLVLTADCDLAKSKHGGALTCVPILDCLDYLLMFRHDRLRDQLLDKLVTRLMNIHEGTASSDEKTRPVISKERMRDWVVEVEPTEAARALELDDGSVSEFVDLASVTRHLAQVTPRSLSQSTEVLAEAKLALGEARDRGRALTWCGAEYSSALKSLPGDALFINEISPAHNNGYVVYLRRVLEVLEESVVRTRSRLPHSARYLRVSRMRSPYVYAISQQFGSVFSSIGLPTEYEVARDGVVARIKSLGG
jgi:hypothetical protein